MSNAQTAKAATQWRAAPWSADDVFRDFAGTVVVHRRTDGAESAPVVRGTWTSPPASEVTVGPGARGERLWRRAVQLWDRTWLYVAALVLLTACGVEPRPEPELYSCVIRFRCVGSEDVLARLYGACSLDRTSAEEAAGTAGVSVATDRCGSWSFVAATCDPDPIDTCEAQP